MTKTKITLAVALLAAAFATPALAQGLVPYYAPQPQYYENQEPFLGTRTHFDEARDHRPIEGRNSAVFGNDFGDTSSTSRDAMVQELGN